MNLSSNFEVDEQTCDDSEDVFLNKTANIRRRRRRAGRNQKNLKNFSNSESPTERTPLMPAIDEERTRQKLEFYFMNPFKKWQEMGHFPYMLILQFIKMILVTMQLYIFAYSRYKQVDYTCDNRISFSHLFLKGWLTSMELYPSRKPPLAIYEKSQFFDTIDHAFTQYASLNSDAGPYSYPSIDNEMSPMELCFYSYREVSIFGHNNSYVFNPEIDRKCLNLTANMSGMPSFKYLTSNNINVKFTALVKATLKFVIKTVNFKKYGPLSAPDCFEFDVIILFDNSDQDGQMILSLNTVAMRHNCRGIFKYIIDLKYHPALRSLLNLTVIFICTVTAVGCIRAIYKDQKLRRETAELFLFKYERELILEEKLEFINFWYIMIIFNDIFIILGSFLKEQIDQELFETDGWDWDLCTIFIGLGNLLAWFEVLQYLRFFKTFRMVILALKKSIWKMFRLFLSTFVIFTGFMFCGWLIFAPYNTKFRSLSLTSECLFALISGDDIYTTFAIMSRRSMMLWWFSKIYLYSFVWLFIYVGILLFLAVMEEYEIIKQYYEEELPKSCLQEFIGLKSTISSSSTFNYDSDKKKRTSLTDYFWTLGPKKKTYESAN